MSPTRNSDNTLDNGQAPAYQAADFVVVRTPLLSWNEFAMLGEGMEAPSASGGSPEALERAVNADGRRMHERLKRLVETPEVREAIFLASPDLEESIALWISAPDSDRGRRVEQSLLRYVGRMAYRPTPFGLFAGCSLGSVGTTTMLELASRKQHQRTTRLDFLFLTELCRTIAREPDLLDGLTFRPNSSLYRAGDRWHYMESVTRSAGEQYTLVAVAATEYLDAALHRAHEGATIAQLADVLTSDDISRDEVLEYLTEVVQAQVLVPNLAPLVTGRGALDELIDQLRMHPAGDPLASGLSVVATELARIDAAGVGVDPAAYRSVARIIEPLRTPVNVARLFQVDLMPAMEHASVGPEVLAEAERAIGTLHRLMRPYDSLQAFRHAFRERYERQEIPLCEVLDVELGIGLPGHVDGSTAVQPDWSGAAWASDRLVALSELLLDAARAGRREIALSEDHQARMRVTEALPPLPASFALSATIVAASADMVSRGDFKLVVNGVDGPSGANLLGRFCHCDPSLERAVRRYLRGESALSPEAVVAEVVHMPSGRSGNVIARPVLREYEIPYLGRSGASEEMQIPITDILVSVVDDRILLRSARLDREILPRCTTAHNFGSTQSLPIYQFLGQVQRQGVAASLRWSWEGLDRLPFLPRVTDGRVVLARAQWRLSRDHTASLDGATAGARFRVVQQLRETCELPRYVVVAEGDNFVPVDFDAAASVEMFVSMVRKRREALLVEVYPSPDDLLAVGQNGNYTHEIIIPFSSRPTSAPVPAAPAREKRDAHPVQRTFLPVSEWVYVKLYSGRAMADQILAQVVEPVVREATQVEAIDRWFFVRYADPDPHLRFRLHGDPARLQRELLPILERHIRGLMDKGMLARVQFDTYHREVERYGGGRGVELAEQLFHVDSEAALAVVRHFAGDTYAHERAMITLRGADSLFAAFGLDDEQVLRLLREFPEPMPSLRRAWSAEYRSLRSDIETVLGSDAGSHERYGPVVRAYDERSARIAAAIQDFAAFDGPAEPHKPLSSLVLDLAHLHLNRALRTWSAIGEQRCYDFLRRFRESARARRRVIPTRVSTSKV